MRTLTHLIAGGAAAATLLTGTAVSASAQSDTLKDKRADVVQIDDLEDETGTVLNRADSIASGIDATSTTVKHGKKSLKVTIRFADLTRKEVFVSAGIRIKGSKKPYTYMVQNEGSKKKVRVYNASGSKRLCTGKLTHKSGKKGTISYTIARSCLKKPKAVKVQSGATRIVELDFETGAFTAVMDVISPTRVRTPTSTKWLKSS